MPSSHLTAMPSSCLTAICPKDHPLGLIKVQNEGESAENL